MNANATHAKGFLAALAPTSIAIEASLDQAANTGIDSIHETQHLKKVRRVLRELAHDAAKIFPHLPIPSPWLTRCLLSTHFCGSVEADCMRDIQSTLLCIRQSSDPHHGDQRVFFELNGTTPLFPNTENFSLATIHLFVSTMLKYLDRKLPD